MIAWFKIGSRNLIKNRRRSVITILAIAFGFAAVAGHVWPVYLKFRGGKGVATASGAVVGFAPLAAGIAAIVFLIVFGLWRMVSLGSISASIALPIAYVATAGDDPREAILYALIAITALVILKHRTNIRRILDGTESKVGRPKKEKEASGA